MTSDRSKLENLFADLRAEWPHNVFGSLFIRPSYFDKLIARRPTLLFGGRGTGKTTSLRSLRFDAAAALLPKGSHPSDLAYFGVYVKLNKNRVRAFGGGGLSERDWSHAFSHYFNLLVCQEFCRLSQWLLDVHGVGAPVPDYRTVVHAFGQPKASPSTAELAAALEDLLIALELFVNNPISAARPLFSPEERPITAFASALERAGYLASGKTIFCCLDEYENLTEVQQSILNTYLKHAEPPVTYKVGIRRHGLQTHSTIDRNDQIVTPDDYSEIDIASEDFDDFARSVSELRLQRATEAGLPVPPRLDDFLPGMSFAREATLLGADRISARVRDELSSASDPVLAKWLSGKANDELYFLGFWQEGHGGRLRDLARSWIEEPGKWRTRFGNYGHASLFWLSRGRKGARIRKHYCGADTFLSLASGNIRYFLELIDESIRCQLARESGHFDLPLVIDGEAQTEAARAVGSRRLGQMEALSVRGVDLKRFVLAIGQVFFEFARDPKKAPETNAFVLSGSRTAAAEAREILMDGVAHLAFEAKPRTKATSSAEMRDDEYRLHPIFCAFFEFSHRRKRRATFSADDLLLLRTAPKRAIRDLLGGLGPQQDLPVQLQMFVDFFEGEDAE